MKLLKKIARLARPIAYRPTTPWRQWPDFIVVGTQKAGTTTLFNYLRQHPEIGMSQRKEVHYFDIHFSKGDAWYLSHFPLRAMGKKVGEVSPYYLFHPLSPERIYQRLPRVKLIALLRNPVDRAYSHFQQERRNNNEPLASFHEAILQEPERIDVDELRRKPLEHSTRIQNYSYLSRGRYAEQIRRYLQFFPKEQLLALRSEDFFAQPEDAMKQIYNFLEVAETFPQDLSPQNVGHYDNAIPAATRRLCWEMLGSDPAELQKLLGDRFSWEH